MDHPRKAIRAAVKKALLMKTACEDRVYKTRLVPIDPERMPAAAVYTMTETIDEDSLDSGPRVYDRRASVIVDVACAGRTESDLLPQGEEPIEDLVDDQLDSIAWDIEQVLLADVTLGLDFVLDVWLASTNLTYENEGRQVYGGMRMSFTVLYNTRPGVSDQLDDFLVADTRYNQNGEQPEADEAHDIITLPQD